jgi:hypothetical protein
MYLVPPFDLQPAYHSFDISAKSKTVATPGLTGGLFSNQKSSIWVNFGGPLIGTC